MADVGTLTVCERCGRAQFAKPPSEDGWLTAKGPVRANVVRMELSVRAQHRTARTARTAATSSTSSLPGRNYGWRRVSDGRDYLGPRVSEHPTREGMESPLVTSISSIAPAGLTDCSGDRSPRWKGNVLVGAMRTGEIPGTRHLERIVFNANTEELRRESLLGELTPDRRRRRRDAAHRARTLIRIAARSNR
jgi:hypothetical protein